MSPSGDDLRSAGKIFRSPPPGATRGRHCPEPERFLQAILGELSTEENGRLVDHAAGCAACTVAWSLAREFVAAGGLAGQTSSRPAVAPQRPAPWRRWRPLAAAAAILLAAVLLVPWKDHVDRTGRVLRASGSLSIESLVAENEPLPRGDFLLRWTPVEGASHFAIRVTDSRLNLLASARALERPEFRVPASALESLGQGAIVLWQVEAVLPGDRRIVSRTFAARLR